MSSRDAIHRWVREDCPLVIKMTMTPDLIEKLIKKLDADESSGKEGS